MNIDETIWKDAFRLEIKVAQLIREQELNGFQLDLPLIRKHIENLERMIEDIDNKILPTIPQFKRIPNNAIVAEPFKRNGEVTERVKKWLGGQNVSGPFTKIFWQQINLDSDDQVKEYLLTQNWRPTEWTYDKITGEKRSPKLTEDSFASIKGDVGQALSKRMMITHRLGILNGLLRDVRQDGRIECRANTVGTPTGRMRHSGVTNIPKAKAHVFYGKEIRNCFIAAPGKLLLDYDAKGLEGRMLCHYMNSPEMTALILEGDIHTKIWNATRDFVDSRDTAKNCFYAIMYGAGDDKLARTADRKPEGMTYQQVGRMMRIKIMSELPALDKLSKAVKMAAKRGYLYGLDKRKLRIRSEHSALNTLLQAGGAIVMKKAMVLFDGYVKESGLVIKKVADWHDESVIEIDPKDSEMLKGLAIKSVIDAGVSFNMNVPLDADAQIGERWGEIH